MIDSALAIGLMSGTSLDGVDAALVRLSEPPLDARLMAFRTEPYDHTERERIVDAIARGTPKDVAALHVALGERFAGAALALCAAAGVGPRQVTFVASHGQTIWHEPKRVSLQLGDPAVIAERLGVQVVSDFRARDVAAGGEGAPLVPLVDVLLFGAEDHGRILLNLGGMANFTWVPRRAVGDGALAFDTGPGVAVVDAVTRRIDPRATFDEGGERAQHGRPVAAIVDALLADPYFDAAPPKSTGRERFGVAYAERLLEQVRATRGTDNDAVATAAELTVESVARAVERWTPAEPGAEVLVSGGGARNPYLMEGLRRRLAPRPLRLFEECFFDGDAKEAFAFAVLGYLTLHGRAGNLPAATGARGPRILGHITPA
jgi:anhydro-N-acetylmuramic acid kinase